MFKMKNKKGLYRANSNPEASANLSLTIVT